MPHTQRLYDAVVFDLDGTLVDTMALHIAATEAASRDVFGIMPLPERVTASLGHPLQESMQIVSDGRGRILELMEAYLAYYGAHESEGSVLFPEAFATLQALHAMGVPLAILSNKLRAWGVLELARLGIDRLFVTAVFAEDMPVPKPSGRAMEPILQALRIPPGRVLFVGDGVHDIACAHAARVQSGAALWGRADPAPLLALRPTYRFTAMREITALLGISQIP
jgi:phosphoglycolate phosphatase-like HAD superfamily hydrolase